MIDEIATSCFCFASMSATAALELVRDLDYLDNLFEEAAATFSIEAEAEARFCLLERTGRWALDMEYLVSRYFLFVSGTRLWLSEACLFCDEESTD